MAMKNMYEDKLFAFLDILGFSNAIDKTIKNDKEIKSETRKIIDFINKMQSDFNHEAFNHDDSKNNRRVINMFSDTIIISHPVNDSGIHSFILNIIHLHLSAILSGFLLRGAIVLEKIYHTETDVFGPAIIKAYKLQEKIAIYPRTILDNDIIIGMSYQLANKKMQDTWGNKLIKKDFDGFYFVDYFYAIKHLDDNVELVTEEEIILKIAEKIMIITELGNIINKLEHTKDISIKAKYLWLKNKFDEYYSGMSLGEELLKKGITEQMFESFVNKNINE
jgi:hypothetical protein